jgi:hypothetical protein
MNSSWHSLGLLALATRPRLHLSRVCYLTPVLQQDMCQCCVVVTAWLRVQALAGSVSPEPGEPMSHAEYTGHVRMILLL